jgi:hypothetical protein
VAVFPHGAKVMVDHPHYRAECALAAGQLQELAKDLAPS